MFYENPPKDFNPKFEIVSCFIEYLGKILLLHRQDHKIEGDTWGAPAGKAEAGETMLEAVLREVEQETGIAIPESQLTYHGKVFVRYPGYDFVYHTFHHQVRAKPRVRINPQEHKAFRWISPREALNLPLIRDEDLSIKSFYRHQLA